MDSAPAAAVSSSPSRKKQKIDGDSALAPPSSEALDDGQQQDEDKDLANLNHSASYSALLQWAENNFEPESSRAIIASSPDLTAREILNFIVKYVYNNRPNDDYVGSNDDDIYVIDEEDENRVKSSRAALEFVTCWLEKFPSLSQLCAQRLAVDIFSSFTDAVQDNVINHIQDNMGHRWWDERLNVLHACILSKIHINKSQPAPLFTDITEVIQNDVVEDVVEELYIFIIVYVLYADLRSIRQHPISQSDVKIPIRKHDIRGNRYGDGDDWWDYFGQMLAYGIVPNSGRGALAKAGLLPHAILTHYLKNHSDLYRAGYSGHLDVINGLIQYGHISEVIHPFACSLAVPSIAAFIHIYHNNDPNYNETDEDKIHQFLLQTYKHWNGGLSPPTDEYDKLLYASKEPPMEVFQDVQNHPLKTMRLDALNRLVGNYLDNYEASEMVYEHAASSKTSVQRLRLRGDHDKAYLLKAAITSNEAQFLDVQDCSSLDEECLVAMLYHMLEVKYVLLYGTSIPEDSNVLQKMSKKRKIHFDFESGVCRYCGRVPFLDTDHVDPPPNELMEENRKLKDENANLRRQLAELSLEIKESRSPNHEEET